MKQPYLFEGVKKAASDTDDYSYSDRVKTGQILIVTNISASWSDIANTEETHFFIEDGARKIFLGEDVPVDAGGHAHWSGEVAIGPGDRVGVYCPDSATGDIVYLWVCGILYDYDAFQKESR